MKNINRTKRLGITLLSIVLIGTTVIVQPETLLYAQEETQQLHNTTGIEVDYHSIEEVKSYIKQSGVSMDAKVTYDVTPVLEGNINMGIVSQKSLDNALGMVNQVRYIAGLSHDVVLNAEQIKMTQAGALVNGLNGSLSHHPQKPAGISEELYQLGSKGAGSSNIAYGYDNFCDAIIHGYMEDADEENIVRVGHRRWILNPSMDATGFGMSGSYQAMYAFSRNGLGNQSGVIWPAQSMPTDYFLSNYPWSISMGYDVDPWSVNVKLTRESDQKVWNFSKNSADGYFNVNNDGCGQSGCIIFRPDGIDAYRNMDQYHVEISGLNTPVSYTVTFFDVYPVENVDIKEKSFDMSVGNMEIIHAEVTPKNATNSECIFISSDPSVATVNDWGYIDAKSPGLTTITATTVAGTHSDSIQIGVRPESIEFLGIRLKGTKSFIVRYDKAPSADGYEIVYSTHPQFKKYKKTVYVRGNNRTVKTIVKANPKADYYIKVRSYMSVNGRKIYGEYSYTYKVNNNGYYCQ